MPADKIVLGIGAYGHGFRVNSTSALGNSSSTLNMYPAFNSSDLFQGSSWDNDPAIDDCGSPAVKSGTYPFWSLVTEAGMLDESGEPKEGIVYGYDDCSQTVCQVFFSTFFLSPTSVLLTEDRLSPPCGTLRARSGYHMITQSLLPSRASTLWTLA